MLIFAALVATLHTGTAPRTEVVRPSSSVRVSEGHAAFAAVVARLGVPSFSRQTKLACTACHNGFPQLTAFGRLFKLNGYTLNGLESIVAQKDSASATQLQLLPIAPISLMAIIDETHIATATPNSQTLTAQFPQEISLFAAAAIAPKMGIFSQFTYEDQEGTIGIDNVDIRFASHTMVRDRDLLYGVTLHNNPTVQDVWNSTPAWSYPFTSASVAPTPAAATVIEDALGQSVLGLGAYSLIDNTVYAELTGYVAAPQGTTLPLDDSAENTTRTVSPYWRLAVQHDFGSSYLMLGTFGLSAKIYPTGIIGPTNNYTDVGVDGQLEHKVGNGMLIGRASYIHESQTLSASFPADEAEHNSNKLNSYKINLSFLPDQQKTLTLGYFGVSGSTDHVLYDTAPVTGSRTGSPTSSGETVEFTVNPWLNVRLGAQYVIYQKFNGSSSAYDVRPNGRSAHDNNTLYLYLWFAY
jgi:hypothetical protein